MDGWVGGREGGRERERERERERRERDLANMSNEHGDGKDAVVGVFLGEEGQDRESHGEGLGTTHQHKRLVERQLQRQSHAQPVIDGQKEHVHDRSPHETHDGITNVQLAHPCAQSQRGTGREWAALRGFVASWLRGLGLGFEVDSTHL